MISANDLVRTPEMRVVTWLDFVLITIPPALAALGAERRWVGFSLAVVALALLHPLLVLGTWSPLAALVAALVAGVAVSVVVRMLVVPRRTRQALQQVLGGVGGFVMGAVLVLTLVTSLPIQRNPINSRELFYPPRNLPEPLTQAVAGSELVEVGRDILLFPLLDGRVDYTDWERAIYSAFHEYLIVGTPWER